MSEIILESETSEFLQDSTDVYDLDLADQEETEVFQDDGISLYSAYDGSFSSTYVEYFRGYVSKLQPGVHYICFRDGQYSYVLYYSRNLSRSGDWVSGSADYYRLNTYSSSYKVTSGFSNVSENITSGMYYSDLPGCPDLRGGDYYVQIAFFLSFCVFCIACMLVCMYRLSRHYRFRSK